VGIFTNTGGTADQETICPVSKYFDMGLFSFIPANCYPNNDKEKEKTK